MVISNEELKGSTPVADKDLYIRMRQSLDSLTSVALAEFDLSVSEQFSDPDFTLSAKDAKRKKVIETDILTNDDMANLAASTRGQIADTVLSGVEAILSEIGILRATLWRAAATDRAADFALHARLLSDEGFKAVSVLSETELNQSAARASDGESHLSCPPGFIEVDGICVPI